MPPLNLPIMQPPPAPSPDLLRLALRAEESCSAALTDPLPLACGAAYASQEFPNLPEATCVYLSDTALENPRATAEEITTTFQQKNLHPSQIHLPTSKPPNPSQLNQLHQFFQSNPLRLTTDSLMRMTNPSFPDEPPAQAATIIPGRAALALLRHLAESTEQAWAGSGTTNPGELAQSAAAATRLLDDPHIDNLLALTHDDPPVPIGTLYLAPANDALLIYNLYVHPAHTRRRIATTLLHHAADLAARSRAKHLLLFCNQTNTPALTLYQKIGFTPITPRHTLTLTPSNA
ncbi:MAG TPA: GNAT family N-acetyltransferase [Phycisphaerae bacterium]|nr:GNAT family N-acetyltransferase [Phycisphaerae bacterium]